MINWCQWGQAAESEVKVLVVEDDPDIRHQLVEFLLSHEFLVESAGDGEEALKIGNEMDFDAVILDPGLPHRDGTSVLRAWRKNGRNFPVIILTGTRRETDDQVELIDAGATVFMEKPVELPKILAWVRNVANMRKANVGKVIRYGALEIDTSTRRVSLEQRSIPLGTTEYSILEYLVVQNGRPVSRETLADHCLGNDRGAEQINVYVGRLRRSLGQRAIQTVKGRGYFIAVD